MRDLFGREAADLAQRQRHLRIRRQRRMAAGENQPQPVVLDVLAVELCGIIGEGVDLLGDIVERVEPGAPADAVDGLEAAGRNQPRPRIGGHAIARPLLERGAESVVQRLFGEVEVAEQADQRGEDAARLGAVDGVHHLPHPFGSVLTHV